MVIKRIKLVNFRNIGEAALTFSSNFNYIFGRNAQGKTNLLEAIHFFSLGRSFRTSRRSDMINFGSDHSFLSMEALSDSLITFSLDAGFDRNGTLKVNLNGKRASGVSEIIGLVPSVIFTSEDIGLAGGEPRQRRFYLDYTASQISAAYLSDLKRFKRALKQRNALLREMVNGASPDGIDEWSESYVKASVKLVKGRMDILEKITPKLKAQFERIMGKEARIELRYSCSFGLGSDSLEEDLRQSIANIFEVEKRRGYSLIGPQYDDLRITIDGVDVRRYGSQGQRRIVALVLKLAQVVAIMEERRERPIVLLDDIMSELDEEKAEKVRELISNSYQSFLTTPREQDIPKDIGGAAFFVVEDGKITRPKK